MPRIVHWHGYARRSSRTRIWCRPWDCLSLKEKGRRKTRRPRFVWSDGLEIGRLGAPRVGLDVERHLLPFGQGTQAGRFHGRGMDEHVLAAAFRSDEAETLACIEEFDSTDGHLFPLD